MSRIDVVVPCYNYGCFLRECVESVLEQSHKDLRVLIIDDASSDDTPAVSAELAARDARIDVSRHPLNRGHIATYNEGIQRAQGDYLLLLSADDFLLPGALERAIAVLDARPEVGLVYGACMLHRPDDQTPRPIQYVTHAGVGLIDPATFIDVLAFGNCVNTATAVVRTSLQQQLGGYRTQLPHAGDLEMWLRFALRGRVVCIDTPQAVYRQHGRNMSRGYDEVADLHQVGRPSSRTIATFASACRTASCWSRRFTGTSPRGP
jgi:glycosyltransferase involved in cell wall biosynthesis